MSPIKGPELLARSSVGMGAQTVAGSTPDAVVLSEATTVVIGSTGLSRR